MNFFNKRDRSIRNLTRQIYNLPYYSVVNTIELPSNQIYFLALFPNSDFIYLLDAGGNALGQITNKGEIFFVFNNGLQYIGYIIPFNIDLYNVKWKICYQDSFTGSTHFIPKEFDGIYDAEADAFRLLLLKQFPINSNKGK